MTQKQQKKPVRESMATGERPAGSFREDGSPNLDDEAMVARTEETKKKDTGNPPGEVTDAVQ